MKNSSLIIVKIGGAPAGDGAILRLLMQDIAELSTEYRIVLVHGGGKQVSAISRVYGIEPRFVEGKRMTSEAEMDIIDMGLAGLMNTALLRTALTCQVSAVGLSGADAGLFIGESVAIGSRTGRITAVNTGVVEALLAAGYVPVISPVSSDINGGGLNINADDAALALAAAMRPDKLVFVSDIPGVLDIAPGEEISPDMKPLPTLTPQAISRMITDGRISGGMIPKVENAVQAVSSGCKEAVIGTISSESGLKDLIEHRDGTSVQLEESHELT